MSYFFHRIALGFLLFMLLSLPSHMSAQTYINGGAVYGEWAKEDSPYHILGDITVPDSLELVRSPTGFRQEITIDADLRLKNLFARFFSPRYGRSGNCLPHARRRIRAGR